MKRGHPDPDSSGSSSYGSSGKGKMWEEEQDAAAVDELLAVLGYKVQASDMADVAQPLEQLEMVMDLAQEDGISHTLFTIIPLVSRDGYRVCSPSSTLPILIHLWIL